VIDQVSMTGTSDIPGFVEFQLRSAVGARGRVRAAFPPDLRPRHHHARADPALGRGSPRPRQPRRGAVRCPSQPQATGGVRPLPRRLPRRPLALTECRLGAEAPRLERAARSPLTQAGIKQKAAAQSVSGDRWEPCVSGHGGATSVESDAAIAAARRWPRATTAHEGRRISTILTS